MKKIGIIAVVILALLGLITWCFVRREGVSTRAGVAEIVTAKTDELEPSSNPHAREQQLPKKPVPNPETDPVGFNDMRLKEMEAEREKAKDEWRTPIEFYGKVVDQDAQPIPQAEVGFSCNDLSVSGTSTYHTTSDSTGLFSISGIAGKLLVVKVTKDGYYASNRDTDSFYYAGQNENFTPDAVNPVIFHLRKTGTAEPLAHCKTNFHIESDGRPLAVDLLRCSKADAVGQNHLLVECWIDDDGKRPGEHYDWRCQISVPGGGILISTNEFDFEAPAEGYQPYQLMEKSKSQPSGWHSNEKRKYFGKTANGQFFRLSFEIVAAGDHFVEIETFLNPSGSRNLEFSPDKVINSE